MYQMNTLGGYDSDGDNDYHPYSNLQKRFPNTKYMGGLYVFVSRCHNLKSLGLKGTQCINLDLLIWRPTNTGLENVHLNRCAATAFTLATLLSPSASTSKSSSNIIALELLDVQLHDGTWSAVFDHLKDSPSLLHINVYNALYDRYGNSAVLYEANNQPAENRAVIWSEEERDWRSLRKIASQGSTCFATVYYIA